MKVGAHISIAGSINLAIERAKAIQCETFQIFTRNPRRWSCKEISDETAKKFKEKVVHSKINPIIAHMPYLPNLASPDKEIWEKSVESLKLEIKRCEQLAISYLVTHLGSPKTAGRDFGISRVASALNLSLIHI